MIPEPRVHFEYVPLVCGATYRVEEESRGGRVVIGWVRPSPVAAHLYVFRPRVPYKGWGDPGAPAASREEAVYLWRHHMKARR